LNWGTLTVSSSSFSANSAYWGGGIDNVGTLTVSSSTFAKNLAHYGGGGIDSAGLGTVTVLASTFSGNSAPGGPGYGGGGASTTRVIRWPLRAVRSLATLRASPAAAS
jgi:hypothetical protein